MENTRVKWKRIALCALTTLLCVLTCAWIFSNSLQNAEESTATSQGVVDIVQAVAGAIAPNSSIATATGEAYEKLHAAVRVVAHFCEFAWLGALMVWCWRSYTAKKVWVIAPVAGIVSVPIIDEWLQSTTVGRAAEFLDVVIDVSGGIFGAAFAVFTIWLGIKIIRNRKRKKESGIE